MHLFAFYVESWEKTRPQEFISSGQEIVLHNQKTIYKAFILIIVSQCVSHWVLDGYFCTFGKYQHLC